MIVFIDTSAWIKFFIAEEGTQAIQEFLLAISSAEENTICASAVTYAEMHATLKRALRGNRLNLEQYTQAIAVFQEQWESVDIPAVNQSLIRESGNLAQQHILKGCDAFQLASALTSRGELFISSDDDLQTAAREKGLSVWNPVEGSFFKHPDEQNDGENSDQSGMKQAPPLSSAEIR